MNIVARFEVPYYQFLDENSRIVSELPAFAKNSDHLLHLYRLMVFNRVLDTKAIALQRTGKMGTYPSIRGQEAAFVGVGDAMDASDIFVPYYRDIGVLLQRGVKLSDIFLYWGGDERGNQYASANSNFPYSVPVGSQPLHAVGIASALTIRNEKHAVLTICGEGGTSQGDFYEAMNVAGVWQLPVVFVINNNQWAISVSRKAQTSAETIAQKAFAAGFSGEQVDGNDVIAVRERTDVALKKAREHREPTLIEIIDYRQSDHTTADDARRYEPQTLRETEWKKEPIARLRQYLETMQLWDDAKEQLWQDECTKEVEKSVEEYLQTPPAPLESMIDYLYETVPSAYSEQREHIKNLDTQGVKVHG